MTYNGFPGCTNSSLENSDICFCSNKLTSFPMKYAVAVIIFNIGQTSLLYGKELLND